MGYLGEEEGGEEEGDEVMVESEERIAEVPTLALGRNGRYYSCSEKCAENCQGVLVCNSR